MKNIPVSLLPKVSPSDPLYGVVENIRALAEAVETLGGLRAPDGGGRALTARELAGTGLVALDVSGRLYNPNRTAPALNTDSTLRATRNGTQVYWEISGAKGVGTHLMTGNQLPEGAVMIWAMYRVRTAAASATSAAVLSLGIDGDDPEGLVAPVAINDPSAPWAAGSYNCIPNRRDPAKDTDPVTVMGRRAVLTVSGEALTDCNIMLIGEYVLA